MELMKKVRVGRAALDWSQEDLAQNSGLSRAAIANIERGSANPDTRTINKINRAFENQGLHFSSHGFEERDLFLKEFSTYIEVLEDIEKVLSEGGEVLVHCADEKRSSEEVIAKLNTLKQKGIGFRTTICEGDTYILGDIQTYRWVPQEYFANSNVSLVYGRNYVKHVQEGDKNIFITINSVANAAVERKQFEYWWKTGKKVSL